MVRQLIRLRAVRAPDEQNDTLNQAQVRQIAATAETYEDFNQALLSQVRLAQGSQSWTQPPNPTPGDTPGGSNENGYPSHAGQVILGEYLSGDHDGTNMVFQLSHYAVPQTVAIWYNGVRLGVGGADDYLVSEATIGQGYGTITLTGAVAPLPRDRLWADYTRSA